MSTCHFTTFLKDLKRCLQYNATRERKNKTQVYTQTHLTPCIEGAMLY